MNTPRGFSVLEILIAMAVVLTAITGAALMSPGTQATSVDSQLNIEALNKAQELLENEQALARKDFKLVNPDYSTTTVDGFNTRVYATPVDLRTKRVTAVVGWNAQYGREQAVSLSTLVSDFQNAIGGDTCSSIVTGNWSSPSATNLLFGTLVNDANGTYQISDLDIYQKRLYVVMNQISQTVGANNAVSAINDNAVGTLGWVNPDRVLTSNDSRATRTLSGTQVTNYLKAFNFGFSIPRGATIMGIRVDVERRRSGGFQGEVRDSQVRIVRANGTIGSENKANTGTNWSTTESSIQYGGSADLWDEEWTAADINDPDFGVVLAVSGSSGSTNRTAEVDNMRVTVTYRKQFYALNASNPTSPVQLGQLTVATTTAPVDAGFTGVAVATSTVTGAYAFVSTNSSAGQLQIIDVLPTTPKIVETYTIAGAPGANAIFYKDGYIYLGLANNSSGPEFYILDVHNPLNIPALLPGDFVYEVGAGVNAIYVKNNKAYIATDDPNRELVVLNLSDLANPTLFDTYDAPGATGGLGKSLFTVGDTAYFGRYYSLANQAEFRILSTALAPVTTIGNGIDIGTGSNTAGVYGTIVRDYLSFLLTGNTTSGGAQVQIYNTANPSSITSVATVGLPGGGAGAPVALECEENHLYAASVPLSGTNQNRGSITVISAP